MYKNCIFDLYGCLLNTVVNLEDESVWNKMTMYYSFHEAIYEADEFKAKFYKYYTKLVEVQGTNGNDEVDLLDVFYQMYKKKGIIPKKKMVRETAKVFRLLSLEHISLHSNVKAVLKKLRDNNVKVFILSNAQGSFVKNELTGLGLNKLFDKAYISSETGLSKPDRQVIDQILKENDIKPKKTIMIGSRYDMEIRCANNAEIDSIYVRRFENDTNPDQLKSTYTIDNGDLTAIIPIILGEA